MLSLFAMDPFDPIDSDVVEHMRLGFGLSQGREVLSMMYCRNLADFSTRGGLLV